MSEPFFLDFFIGLLLLASLAIFYETTVIFYVMLFFHMICLVFCIGIVFNFSTFFDDLRTLASSIIGFAIPFIIQILFSAAFVILRARLNEAMTTDDLVLICATPALVLTLPFLIPGLRKFIPKQAKYSIYDTGNIFGLITNTFILILGGLIGWNILHFRWSA